MNGLFEHARNTLITYGPNVVAAVVIFIVGWLVAKASRRLLRGLMTRRRVDPTLIGFFCSLLYIALMALVVISTLARLGVNTTSFAAVIAAAGLAIGLALQGSLGNFASGVLLIFFRPFKVGDFIEAGGIAGIVQEIQVFSTRLCTPDNKTITVPNAAITGGTIINYSANNTRRVDLVFGISYADDIRKAKQILENIMARDGRVLKDPAPMIAVFELAESSVNIAVRPWVKAADYWGVLCDVTEAVKLEFDAAGVSIPFPQRDVHVHQAA
jgi:small conductance mechanosensitive channel